MLSYHDVILALVLLGSVAGCGDSQIADNSSGAVPAIQNPESTKEAPTESTLLKQEMIDVAVEVMQAQKPDADPKELRGQVQEMLDAEIIKIRKQYPEFLIVSAETKKRLQSGTPIPDAAERIANADEVLRAFEIDTHFFEKTSSAGSSTAFKVQTALLPQHKAGTLSPIRTNLLAQLMDSNARQLGAALK